ncbi:MAG: hypothetical protein WCF92_00620 [bacterium]
MKNKHFTIVIILVIVSLFSGFFAGAYYKGSQTSVTTAQNSSSFTRGTTGNATRTRAGGGGTFGDIISKDDQSITISLPTGGSQIIFVNPSTSISKSVSGTLADLNTGTSITVTGSTNSDGASLTATSINIRPQTASSTNPKN